MSIVLDASAVIALLKNERGAAKVEAVIGEALVGAVNHAEIACHYAHLGAAPDDVREMLASLPYTVVPADASLALAAGALRPATAAAGLSLGGCFCLALGQSRGLKVMTADRAWAEPAKSLGIRLTLIR